MAGRGTKFRWEAQHDDLQVTSIASMMSGTGKSRQSEVTLLKWEHSLLQYGRKRKRGLYRTT